MLQAQVTFYPMILEQIIQYLYLLTSSSKDLPEQVNSDINDVSLLLLLFQGINDVPIATIHYMNIQNILPATDE